MEKNTFDEAQESAVLEYRTPPRRRPTAVESAGLYFAIFMATAFLLGLSFVVAVRLAFRHF